MKLFDWLEDIRTFWSFLRPSKDERGRIPGFLYSVDDPSVSDNFLPTQVFAQRVFISFERSSLPLAANFENALTAQGLEPWRYTPIENVEETCPRYSFSELKAKYPRTFQQLLATVRRCPAVLFLVSHKANDSQMCRFEAFCAAIIHGFWPEKRARNEAGIFIILEDGDVSVPQGLEKFWCRVYEPELEVDVAHLIRLQIDRFAEILQTVEHGRAQRFR